MFTAAYSVWMMTRPGTFAFGVAMLLFAVYTAARLLRGRLRARRLTPRWDAMIAAAQADPVAHDLLQAANDVPAPRDWRQWARFVAAAAIYGGACGVMLAGIGSTHTTCATAAPRSTTSTTTEICWTPNTSPTISHPPRPTGSGHSSSPTTPLPATPAP